VKRLLSWLLWSVMMVCGVAALVGSLAHGRTPTTMALTAIAVLALVAGARVDARRGVR
jgi:membrane protein YdbS with pleckstrin-like domain